VDLQNDTNLTQKRIIIDKLLQFRLY